jgi:hypothetical protein
MPLTISDDDLAAGLDILERALEAATAGATPSAAATTTR